LLKNLNDITCPTSLLLLTGKYCGVTLKFRVTVSPTPTIWTVPFGMLRLKASLKATSSALVECHKKKEKKSVRTKDNIRRMATLENTPTEKGL
jgi:hypothetical protein